jgi:hypothetical protein
VQDGGKLYLLNYDSEAEKWYQISATVKDGFIVAKTKLTGGFAVLANKVG